MNTHNLKVEIPLRLPSVANLREHFRVRAERVASERLAVRLALRSYSVRPAMNQLISVGMQGAEFEVTLTRIAPRPIRDVFENLPMCFKGVVDELASELGIDDSEFDIKKPKQERGPYAVRIEVSASVSP